MRLQNKYKPEFSNRYNNSAMLNTDKYALTHEEFLEYDHKKQLLGHGGFGKVYKVKNKSKVYAMKVIDINEVTQRYMLESPMKMTRPKPNTSARNVICSQNELKQNILNSLLNEVKIMKELKHPNVVSIFHYYIDESQKMESKPNIISSTPYQINSMLGHRNLYIIMEYTSYGSLLNYIKIQQGKHLTEVISAGITSQILDGLIYLSSLNIIHGDIKAANILIFPNGIIKIADFGLSFQWDDENLTGNDENDEEPISKSENAGNNKRLQQIATNGSAYWLAPEIILHRMATPKSDIWSLGATIIEMLTGSPPFSNKGPLTACHAVGSGSKIEYPNGLTKECRSFLDCCFTYDPTSRPRAKKLKMHIWIKHIKTNILGFVEMDDANNEEDGIDDSIYLMNNTKKQRDDVEKQLEKKNKLLESFKEDNGDFQFNDNDFLFGKPEILAKKNPLPELTYLDKLSILQLKDIDTISDDSYDDVLEAHYTSCLINILNEKYSDDCVQRAEQVIRIGQGFLKRHRDEVKRVCLSGCLVPLSLGLEGGTRRLVADLVVETWGARGLEWLMVCGFKT